MDVFANQKRRIAFYGMEIGRVENPAKDLAVRLFFDVFSASPADVVTRRFTRGIRLTRDVDDVAVEFRT